MLFEEELASSKMRRAARQRVAGGVSLKINKTLQKLRELQPSCSSTYLALVLSAIVRPPAADEAAATHDLLVEVDTLTAAVAATGGGMAASARVVQLQLNAARTRALSERMKEEVGIQADTTLAVLRGRMLIADGQRSRLHELRAAIDAMQPAALAASAADAVLRATAASVPVAFAADLPPTAGASGAFPIRQTGAHRWGSSPTAGDGAQRYLAPIADVHAAYGTAATLEFISGHASITNTGLQENALAIRDTIDAVRAAYRHLGAASPEQRAATGADVVAARLRAAAEAEFPDIEFRFDVAEAPATTAAGAVDIVSVTVDHAFTELLSSLRHARRTVAAASARAANPHAAVNDANALASPMAAAVRALEPLADGEPLRGDDDDDDDQGDSDEPDVGVFDVTGGDDVGAMLARVGVDGDVAEALDCSDDDNPDGIEDASAGGQ